MSQCYHCCDNDWVRSCSVCTTMYCSECSYTVLIDVTHVDKPNLHLLPGFTGCDAFDKCPFIDISRVSCVMCTKNRHYRVVSDRVVLNHILSCGTAPGTQEDDAKERTIIALTDPPRCGNCDRTQCRDMPFEIAHQNELATTQTFVRSWLAPEVDGNAPVKEISSSPTRFAMLCCACRVDRGYGEHVPCVHCTVPQSTATKW
jgi:hypothetical protein